LIKSHISLLSWYTSNGRHELPWRTTDDVYHVYISEVMLQQTQVKRILDEYYFPFLERFPSLYDLANADIEEVFSLWSGLGYYRRAANLHKSAKLCAPSLPTTVEELLKLPGIGRYTAHAIISFGYKECVSVVDTNIARVLTRFFALRNPSDAELWQKADEFLNTQNPTHHNLALMDLGSLICLPKNPTCHTCPLQLECVGQHVIEDFTKTKKTIYTDKNLYFAIYIKDGKIAMQRKNDGMYKDMLTLPALESPLDDDCIGSFKHAVTRYKLEIYLYRCTSLDADDLLWIDLQDISTQAISSMTQKALQLVEAELHKGQICNKLS